MSAQQQSASIAVQQLTLTLVSFTLVVYDHAITFAQEVTFFWSSPWSPSRILYLSIRYLALAQVCLTALAQIGTAKFYNYPVNWAGVLQWTTLLD
ncbi:hypothetical protein C8R48DRAFT_108406 [Suillus tomentosus]|nr:hypothetical protein C8R48DRAFT_108406 [Suillus tomentosus]